jgi:2-(1,2-epoxy-1,2-dihydrophenyl)acetyl-CoA isomerase
VRCILITAEGPHFCLGGDVAGFAAAPDPGGYVDELAAALHTSLVRLDAAGVPVVVGAQGWAAGAGLSLVLAADVVVLERGARLRTAYAGIGLSPDGGMSWTLPRAIGRARAMDMLLTNRPMGAEEALAAGLASRVVDDGTGAAAALAIARAIAGGPRGALAAARALAGRDRSFPAHLDAERASISGQAAGPEGREGVAAFLDRRAPAWPDPTAAPTRGLRPG